MGKRACKGTNAAGRPCGAHPLKPGTEIEGTPVKGGHCRRHDPDLPASVRFGSRAQATAAGEQGGRPRNPTPSEVARRLIESNELALQRPYWRTLGFDVVLGDDGPELKPLPLGAQIYGESKDGEVIASGYEDLEAQQQAAERLKNRVYGKPKQQTEITGASGGPVEIVPVAREKASQVGALISRVGAAKADG